MIATHPVAWLVLGTCVALLGGGSRSEHPSSDTNRMSVADDTTVLSYVVDSVRVVQRLNPFTDVIAVNVYLLGGSRQLTAATQGIEAMLATASRYGTRSFPDTTLRTAWGMTGSESALEITNDWTMLGFRGVRDEFDRSWDIVTERLTAPTLRPDAVDVARDRLISGLRRRRSTPDGEVTAVSDSVVFAGHAYGLSPYGTDSALARLDSAKLAEYVQTQVTRSRLLVIVAGAATRAMVEAAIHRSLGRVPVGQFTWSAPPPLVTRTGSVTFVPRRTATNYLIGVFEGPAQTHEDYPAFRTATSFLGQLITTEVREKRGLSYAASADVEDRALVTGMIYVTTGKPDTVLRLIQRQIMTLQDPDSLPSGSTFTSDRNSLSNLFRRSTSGAQVDALAHAELLQGDYRLADNLPRRMRTVSSTAVRQAARRYMQNIRYVYAGDTTIIHRKSFQKP
ncbi:MAG: insulinase family protein [Gemmatimonadaceae bacterium]|nr:insulinase family protein [Gemmatimonadaceae bacterium]